MIVGLYHLQLWTDLMTDVGRLLLPGVIDLADLFLLMIVERPSRRLHRLEPHLWTVRSGLLMIVVLQSLQQENGRLLLMTIDARHLLRLFRTGLQGLLKTVAHLSWRSG